MPLFSRKPLEPLSVYDLAAFEKESARTNIHLIHDPVYKRPKTYTAVSLQPLFNAMATNRGSDFTLIFRCTDGYAPAVNLGTLRGHEGFLAVRDDDAKGGQSWEPFADGKSPAPYYIIWPAAKDSKTLPWPYQVTKIEVYETGQFVQRVTGRARQHRGRDVFFRSCISCHSLAGMGGTVGPDLASPTKVTAYWKQPYLRKFISNPLSVRANSKMPAPQLSEKEVDDVIEFLAEL